MKREENSKQKSAQKQESEYPTAEYDTVLGKAGKTEKLFPYYSI